MEKILLNGQDPQRSFSIPPCYLNIVNANIHKCHRFNKGSRKRARRQSDKQHITAIVPENYKTPNHSFSTNTFFITEIQGLKPQAKLLKLLHMRNGNIPFFPQEHPLPQQSTFTMARRLIQSSTIHLQTRKKTKRYPPIWSTIQSTVHQRNTHQQHRWTVETRTGKTRHQYHQDTPEHKQNYPSTYNVHQDPSHQPQQYAGLLY